jgi:hypothetical protein
MHLVIGDVPVFGVNNYKLRARKSGTTEGTTATDKAKLTSNPICATILARDAPGSMSQEPTIRMEEAIVRVCAGKKVAWRTDDGLLRLSAVLEEFMESKVAGGHSEGS